MSNRWMRGPAINTPGTTHNAVDHVPAMMLVYHFLTKVLGFTHIDEQVTGSPTRSFQNGYEANNTDGVLTATDLTFSSAANPFAAGDVGKFLVVVDGSNPENCGIYEIATFVGAGQVTINYYVPGGTFPTAATGLSWWMFDTNNAAYTPVTFGDFFVVRSPHSTYPFEIYAEEENIGNYIGTKMEFSPDSGSWDAVGHAWNSGAKVLNYLGAGNEQWMFYDRFYSDAPHSRRYIIGDTDGSFVLFVTDRNVTSSVNALMAAVVEPLETSPARSASERLLIAGYNPAAANQEVDRGDDQGGLGFGQVWEEYGAQKRYVQLMNLREDVNLVGYQDYFSRNLGVNARTGERDALPLLYSIEGEGQTDFTRFAPHSKVPIGNAVTGTAVAVGELTSFDSDQYFHIRDGIVVPWCGKPSA